MKLEIINHGVMYSDYFQGCGTAFTDYEYVATGIGHTEREAFNDAIDQLSYSIPGDLVVNWWDVEQMAIAQYGEPSREYITDADGNRIDEAEDEVYLFISIRFSP